MPINGLVVMTPTSIVSVGTGSSSSINANGSVDFSACETLSLNGVFTSSYDNYMIVMRELNTGTNTWTLRFRLSGTDNSAASSYTYQDFSASGNSSPIGSRASSTYSLVANSTDTVESGFTLYLFGPNLAQPTAWRSVAISGNGYARVRDWAGTHNVSTAYDGITLDLLGTPVSTGLVTVFGFNQ